MLLPPSSGHYFYSGNSPIGMLAGENYSGYKLLLFGQLCFVSLPALDFLTWFPRQGTRIQ
jgi:hypothetical protein